MRSARGGWGFGLRTLDLEPRTWNLELRTWNLELGTLDLGRSRSKDQRPKTKDQRPKTKDQRPNPLRPRPHHRPAHPHRIVHRLDRFVVNSVPGLLTNQSDLGQHPETVAGYADFASLIVVPSDWNLFQS